MPRSQRLGALSGQWEVVQKASLVKSDRRIPNEKPTWVLLYLFRMAIGMKPVTYHQDPCALVLPEDLIADTGT